MKLRNFQLHLFYRTPSKRLFLHICFRVWEDYTGCVTKTLFRIWGNFHYVKSVQIRSFFWSVFFHIRTEYGERFFILLWNNMTLNSHSEFSNTTLVSFIQPRSLEDILHSCRNVRAYKINIMTAKSTKWCNIIWKLTCFQSATLSFSKKSIFQITSLITEKCIA